MNTDGGDLKQLTNDANDSNWPMWTPDGKSLVYHHISSSGYQTIWKIPSAGGTPVQVTDRFSLRPAVSPKDGTIACWYTEQPANPKWVLAILPPDGGRPLKTFPIASTTSVESMIRWTPDGRGITYIDEKGGVSNICVQTIDGAPPRQITNFNSDRIFSFDWSKSAGRHSGAALGSWEYDSDLIYSRGLRTNDIVLITDAH
jgi:Tol biopolymer transport system component